LYGRYQDIKLACAKVKAVRKNIVNSFGTEIGVALGFKLGSILGIRLGGTGDSPWFRIMSSQKQNEYLHTIPTGNLRL
jgi:hypothetical protein